MNKDKIYNINLVLDELKEFPQTYKTILGDLSTDGTSQFILRRKLNNLLKTGEICKTSIPGTRFGKAIFYILPKKYYILIEAGRLGSIVFCFYKFEKISNYYIKVNNCWQLKNDLWIKIKKEKIFFEGNILKLI